MLPYVKLQIILKLRVPWIIKTNSGIMNLLFKQGQENLSCLYFSLWF